MKLLHIISSPRDEKSNTLLLASTFIEKLKGRYPDLEVEELNLFQENLPAAAGANIDAKYNLLTRQPLNDDQQASWGAVETMVNNFCQPIYIWLQRRCGTLAYRIPSNTTLIPLCSLATYSLIMSKECRWAWQRVKR